MGGVGHNAAVVVVYIAAVGAGADRRAQHGKRKYEKNGFFHRRTSKSKLYSQVVSAKKQNYIHIEHIENFRTAWYIG